MRRQPFTLILGFGTLLALLVFAVQAVNPARAQTSLLPPARIIPLQANPQALVEGFTNRQSRLPGSLPSLQTFDASKCRRVLQKTAARLGWAEPEIYVNDYGTELNCQMTYVGSQDGVPYQIFIQISAQASWCDDCAYYCEGEGNQNNCQCVDIHGLPGRLDLPLETQGSFLAFCDAYCNLVFRVNSLSEDKRAVDTRPYADALYYSALEINCCQAADTLPPEELQPTEDVFALPPDAPPADPPENQPGDLPNEDLPAIPPVQPPSPATPLASSPLVPLIGAVIGTVIGWLVSLVVTNWSPLMPTLAPPPAPEGPPPPAWKEWERTYTVHDLPTYRGPDIVENSSVHISVEDAKDAVIQTYSNDLPPQSKARVAGASMRKVEAAEFDGEYLKVYGPDGDFQRTSAFVNPATGEILICTPREINYTPVHELIHVASNPDFGRSTNQAVDEAVTEYFTHRITSQRNVIRSSEYDVLGSTDVIAEIVKIHGEEILRRAYFQTGKEGVETLRQAVDQRLGKGAFARVVELMDQPHAPPKQIALDLLRGQGTTKK